MGPSNQDLDTVIANEHVVQVSSSVREGEFIQDVASEGGGEGVATIDDANDNDNNDNNDDDDVVNGMAVTPGGV